MSERKILEYVSVTLPGERKRIGQVAMGPTETDEQVLQRISTKVGTKFRLTGIDYEVVSSEPFKLKCLSEGESFRRREVEEDEPLPVVVPPPPPTRIPEQFEVTTQDVVAGTDYLHVEIVETPKKAPKVQTEPKTETPVKVRELPKAGETWKTSDPRRSTTFKIVSIEGDLVMTDAGRTVKLDRFNRYQKIG